MYLHNIEKYCSRYIYFLYIKINNLKMHFLKVKKMLLGYSGGWFKSIEKNRKNLLKNKKTDFFNCTFDKYNIKIHKYPLFNIL